MTPLCPTKAQVLAWIACPDAQRGMHGYITQSYGAFRSLVELTGCFEIDLLADAVSVGAFSWRELFDDPAYAFAHFEDILAEELEIATIREADRLYALHHCLWCDAELKANETTDCTACENNRIAGER